RRSCRQISDAHTTTVLLDLGVRIRVYVAINRHGRREHREDHVTKTEALPTHRGGTSRRHDPLFPVAAGAAAFGVCCGLPLLGSLGAAGVIAGLEVGSWITV